MRTFSTSDDNNILIIGGTGTLGKALLAKLSLDPRNKITVLSREELKQQELRPLYPLVRFVLGDVRDMESLDHHIFGKNEVFHLAAMKHVDMAEANPEESIKINLLGTLNVAKCCVASGVSHCVFSSTDKAVLPVNTYGACKMLSERYLQWLKHNQDVTNFSIFRWGNVFGSRGSVIHSFVNSLRGRKEIHITDPRMTRFWVTIDDMVQFILDHYRNINDGPIFPAMKAKRVQRIGELCAHYLGIKDFKTKIVGIRNGEKIHECIYSDHDSCIRSDTAPILDDDEIFKMIEGVVGE